MNKRLKSLLRQIIICVIFGIFIGGILIPLLNDHGFSSFPDIISQSGYSILLAFLFWQGNKAIIHAINRRYSWVKETRKTVTLHLLSTFSYSLIIIFLFYLYIWFVVMRKPNMHGFFQSFRFGFYLCFTLNAIATLFSYSFYFMKYWKKSVLSEEQLKREAITLQYEALKNQVNPHFLFNSLNVLTSLIEHDKKASINYVKQLSNVFRYVLDQNGAEKVPVETELKFIESYGYLHKIRFGDYFKMSLDIKQGNFKIVPMALQILVENAVKHNEISAEYPLIIEISDDDDFLMVKNNIRRRNYLPDSNHVGLQNLTVQYSLLSEKPLEISNDGDVFTVKLPKLEK